MYVDGIGIEQDYDKAFELLSKAYSGGVQQAKIALSNLQQ
jgi:TPR repeat protein